MTQPTLQPIFLPTPDFVAVPAESLTADQRAVADLSPDSVVAVYGAPGSGKTVALQSLVESLVKGQAALRPESILVFAATRDSAATLRDQLALRLQGATEGPMARTISSFAFAVIRYHALSHGQRLPELISGSEQDTLLTGILAKFAEAKLSEHWPEHVTATTFGLSGFRKELRDLIAVCQENNMDADALEQAGIEQGNSQWRAAAEIYREYEQLVSGDEFAHRFDAPRLLTRATELLENDGVRRLVEGYRTIIVDDAHELTPSAARLLEALVRAGCGLILLGDPDVSTMGFRASDPLIMNRLAEAVAAKRFGSPRVLYLGELPTHRDPAILVALGKVSASIFVEGAGRQRRAIAVARSVEQPALSATEQLHAQQPDAFTVKVFKDSGSELAWLARTLREQNLYWGVDYTKMAVVARSRAELESLELALAAHSVPVRVVGAQSALRDEFAANQLLQVLKLAFLPQEKLTIEDALVLLRSIYCGLDSLGLRRLRRALRKQETEGKTPLQKSKSSDELLLELFANVNSLKTLDIAEAKKVSRFLQVFTIARQYAADSEKTIEDLLWLIWNASGVEKVWSAQSRGLSEVAVQANRNLDAVVALFAAANRYIERNPGAGAYEFIIKQLEQTLPEDNLTLSGRGQNTVALLTPSGLIGRRFELVAIPKLTEGVWPNLSPRSTLLGANLLADLKLKRQTSAAAVAGASANELRDELRMFYKALGAAERTVLISSADVEDQQVSQFINLVNGGIPDAEPYHQSGLNLRAMAGTIRRELARETDVYVQAQLADQLSRLAKFGVPGADPKSWYGLAPTSTEEPLFAPSSAPESEWSDSDRMYVKPSQIEDFIKCPLHWFLKAHGGGEKAFEASLGTLIHEAIELVDSADVNEIWQAVYSKWNTLNFEAEWQNRVQRDKAVGIIQNIVKYLNDFEAEGSTIVAREHTFTFNLGAAHVVGQIDRVEKLANSKLRVVDLKTGTKYPSDAEVQVNPQLAMYQLAFLHDAFGDQSGIPEKAELASANLLLVGDPKKPYKLPEQASLTDPANIEKRVEFEELLARMVTEMAMPNINTDGDAPRRYFVANLSSHCNNSHEYGTCSLHMIQAVSHVD